jgi:hypothetical protein
MTGRKSRTLELLAFDEYCRFDTSASFWGIKRGSLYSPKESRSINIHRKLYIRVPTSEREGKLSNPRARAARARCMEKIYGNLRKTARRRRARAMH